MSRPLASRIAPRAVLRREGTCCSSPSDDEIGALQGAIRAKRAQRAEQSSYAEGQAVGEPASACDRPIEPLIL